MKHHQRLFASLVLLGGAVPLAFASDNPHKNPLTGKPLQPDWEDSYENECVVEKPCSEEETTEIYEEDHEEQREGGVEFSLTLWPPFVKVDF